MKRVATLALAIISSAASAQPAADAIGQLSAAGGRYVFGQISAMRRDQYLLDTQTGRVWQLVCAEKDKNDSSKCNLTAFDAMVFFDHTGKPSPSPTPGK